MSQWQLSFARRSPGSTSRNLIANFATDVEHVSDAPSGQLIVVVEAEDSETLIQTIESVRNVEGVLAVSLVYHQQEEQGEETP